MTNYNMKRKFIHHVLIKMTDIALKAFILALKILAFGGIGFVMFQLINDPSQFNNSSFGMMG